MMPELRVIDELIKIVKAPDFPTGARLLGKPDAARKLIRTGTGKVTGKILLRDRGDSSRRMRDRNH